MTIEISKTEKALRLIATEGISAKEAAERVDISRAAVSKGKLWPSKSTQNIRKLCEMENEIVKLRAELAALKAENERLKNQWQPIETAPHYFNSLLLRYNGEMSIANWGDYDEVNQPKFTHWMPLPKPPAMAQGEQK